MTKTKVKPLPIDTEIADAWHELLDARAAFAHSPNADTQRSAVYAEARVNRLLERRHAG